MAGEDMIQEKLQVRASSGGPKQIGWHQINRFPKKTAFTPIVQCEKIDVWYPETLQLFLCH